MKKSVIIVLVIFASIALTAGIVKAASEYNITSTLGGVSGDFFDLDGTLIVDSMKVGAQGVGGVTFFNGTIINNTTGDDDADNPVTFGDNVRIDGRVYRGATAGTGDAQPFIVNDNMEVVGTLTVAGLSGTGIVGTDNIADGVVATADLADSSVTSAKIADGTIATADLDDETVTQAEQSSDATGDSTTETDPSYDVIESMTGTTQASKVFVSFSGDFNTDAFHGEVTVFLIVDGEKIDHTSRTGSNAEPDDRIVLAFNALVDVTAGTHTFQVGWNTNDGDTAYVYNDTLDIIELKK